MRTRRGLLRTCQIITFPFPAQQVWVWGKWAKFGQLECTTQETGWSGQLKFIFNRRLSKKVLSALPPKEKMFQLCAKPIFLIEKFTLQMLKLSIAQGWHFSTGETLCLGKWRQWNWICQTCDIFWKVKSFSRLKLFLFPFMIQTWSLPWKNLSSQLPWVTPVAVTHIPHPQWFKTLLIIR